MRVKDLIAQYFSRSEYLSNVRIVFAGLLISQAFPILISPAVSRIYGPALFGVLALYKGIESVLSIVITGRYHFAILLPKEDAEARHLVAISLLFTVGLSFAILLLFVPFGKTIMAGLKMPSMGAYILWIPLSTALVGGFNTLSYWNTRKGDFPLLSKSRVLLSFSTEAPSIPLGFSIFKGSGLVISRIFGQAVGFGYLLAKFAGGSREMLGGISKKEILAKIREYKDFPLQSGTAGLLNSLTGEIPLFFISSFYGLQVLGWFALSSRIISVPVQLIGSAFSDVFYRKAMESPSALELKRLMIRTLRLLIVPTLLLFVLILILGKWLMGPVFGAEWAPAGVITCAMSFLLVARLIYTSLNAIIFIERRNDYDVKWNAANLVVITLALFIGYKIFHDYRISILFYSLGCAGIYVFNILWMFKVVDRRALRSG